MHNQNEGKNDWTTAAAVMSWWAMMTVISMSMMSFMVVTMMSMVSPMMTWPSMLFWLFNNFDLVGCLGYNLNWFFSNSFG